MFKRKSECQKLQGLLSPYIDGQLDSSDRERLESHLEGCRACRLELESLRATVDLLHQVAMVSTPRSFAIAKAAPEPQPTTIRAFGALRLATAVAVLLLVFVFAGDAANLFEAGLVGDRYAQQEVIPTDAENNDLAGASPGKDLDGGEATFEDEEYIWPVFELELALLGVVVVLGGATSILWQKRRRRGEMKRP
jgi:hypothetical protein